MVPTVIVTPGVKALETIIIGPCTLARTWALAHRGGKSANRNSIAFVPVSSDSRQTAA
jgi:hypothetical protein